MKLSREERRRLQKATVKELMLMKKAVEMEREELLKQKDNLATQYHLVWLLTLRDLYGFGHERLVRTLNSAVDNFTAVSEGYITFDDIRDTLKEEVKLNL